MRLILLIILLISYSVYVEANSSCDYNHKINSKYTKTIQSTQNFNREVYPYIEDTRKCVVSMEVLIDDEWYITSGMFTFSPDMSENQACINAEARAKEQIIRKVSPEVLTAKTDMVCKQEKESVNSVDNSVDIVEEIISNQSTTTKVHKEPIPAIGTVVSETIIYDNPKVISYVKPKPNSLFTSLENFLLTIYYN